MLAFGIVRVGIAGVDCRARRRRSVCVVALRESDQLRAGKGRIERLKRGLRLDLPEWVADYEKRYVLGVCAGQNVVGMRLDHFTVGEDDGSAIVRFLLVWVPH